MTEILELDEEQLVEKFIDLAQSNDIPALTEYFKGENSFDYSL